MTKRKIGEKDGTRCFGVQAHEQFCTGTYMSEARNQKPDFKDPVSRDSTGDVTNDVEPFARRAADWRHLHLKKKVCKHIMMDDGIQTIILFSKVHKVHKIRVFTFKNSNEKKKTRHTRLTWDSNPVAIDTLAKRTYVDDNFIFVVFLYISCEMCLF